MRSVVRNQLGVSYMEVLVALGLTVVLALASSQVIKTTSDASANADRRMAANAIASRIAEQLRYAESCRTAFAPGGNTLTLNGAVPAERDVALQIDNIGAGPNMDQDVIAGADGLGGSSELPGARIKITELKLTDAIDLDGNGPDPDPANKQVLYTVRMSVTDLASETGGMQRKVVTSVILDINTADATWPVVGCAAPTIESLEPVCEGMGCNYDINQDPPCKCVTAMAVCSTPGYFPIAFKNGVPDCRPLGGDSCPANTYLVGVGIERNICSPVPQSGTGPASGGAPTSGAGPTSGGGP